MKILKPTYTKKFSNMEPPLKANFSQQGFSSSGIPPWETDSVRQPRIDKKTTRGRDSPD
jgi:hypothetical protein